MSESLSAVWEQVTDLLSAGVSIIPVRDREQDGYAPKTPYRQWKQYQERIIDPATLWHAMEDNGTSAIAIICGKVSGNLEAIDIDVKNWPGIDARLFEAIQTFYPDLFSRLRIHSTPSGGFHILYRTTLPTGIGNKKLATSEFSTQAGIETRGEGGYIVAPPSLGYKVYRDNPIPVITNEQRESLINLAKSLDEKIKVVQVPKIEKSKADYYEDDPFEHFNLSPAAESVLLDHGWKQQNDQHPNSRYRYYIRPGKDSGISASFHLEKRLYYIFTTSTRLEADRGYLPATILAELKFQGDKKATYRYLVEQGFGRLKPSYEKSLIRARARSGEPLPANASPGAVAVYNETRTTLQLRYPHGIYWDVTDKGKVSINRELMYFVADKLGFRNYHGKVVRVIGSRIHRVTEREFYDGMKLYIGGEEDTCNAFESFIQGAGEFTIGRISLLDETHILKSTKTRSYKFFANCIVEITKEGSITSTYELLDSTTLIWDDQVSKREYIEQSIDIDGLYYQFLDKAIGISSYLWRIIGYLTHEYKDESTGYIIVLVEQCPDPKQGGGTGKNIFSNLIGCTTTLKSVAGVQVQFNEKFLQAWNYERVLALSDIPKRFNFGFLKELSTGSGTLKKLFHDEQSISFDLMPKLILSTNFSYDASDGGLKRRLIPLEFSPFFTRIGGVDVYFGKLFPYEWGTADWLQFDNIIVNAIQQYLIGNGKLEPNSLTEDGWLKQFDQLHMVLTREFIQQHWDTWLQLKFISNEFFNEQYTKFCYANNIDRKFKLSSMRMTQALEDWCHHYKVSYVNNHVKRELLDTIRGRLFEIPQAPF